MEEETYYTPEEIAKLLRMAEGSVTRLLRQKKIPAYKISGQWRIDREEFKAFMAKNRNIQEDK